MENDGVNMLLDKVNKTALNLVEALLRNTLAVKEHFVKLIQLKALPTRVSYFRA